MAAQMAGVIFNLRSTWNSFKFQLEINLKFKSWEIHHLHRILDKSFSPQFKFSISFSNWNSSWNSSCVSSWIQVEQVNFQFHDYPAQFYPGHYKAAKEYFDAFISPQIAQVWFQLENQLDLHLDFKLKMVRVFLWEKFWTIFIITSNLKDGKFQSQIQFPMPPNSTFKLNSNLNFKLKVKWLWRINVDHFSEIYFCTTFLLETWSLEVSTWNQLETNLR